MSNVTNLKGERADIDARCEAAAAMLEMLAGKARRGEITAAAVAFIYADGFGGSLWEADGQGMAMLGAVAVLQHQFCARTE